MVTTVCKPNCPPAVANFASKYEGPYPEGPGSFDKCGGSEKACLTQAGFDSDDIATILRCNSNEKSSTAALKKMEAIGDVKFGNGKGFPQMYIDGKYINPSSTLSELCQVFSSSTFTGKKPAACNTFNSTTEQSDVIV